MARGPQQLRQAVIVISREDSRRLDAFARRVGVQRAPKLLGVGEQTLAAGMEQGRMLRATRERLFATLDRLEAEAKS